jgi:hypothetical protein
MPPIYSPPPARPPTKLPESHAWSLQIQSTELPANPARAWPTQHRQSSRRTPRQSHGTPAHLVKISIRRLVPKERRPDHRKAALRIPARRLDKNMLPFSAKRVRSRRPAQ